MTSHHSVIKKIAQKLEDWDYELDRFEHRVQDLSEELKHDASIKIMHFRKISQDAAKQIDGLENTSDQAFDELNHSLDEAWIHFKLIVEKYINRESGDLDDPKQDKK